MTVPSSASSWADLRAGGATSLQPRTACGASDGRSLRMRRPPRRRARHRRRMLSRGDPRASILRHSSTLSFRSRHRFKVDDYRDRSAVLHGLAVSTAVVGLQAADVAVSGIGKSACHLVYGYLIGTGPLGLGRSCEATIRTTARPASLQCAFSSFKVATNPSCHWVRTPLGCHRSVSRQLRAGDRHRWERLSNACPSVPLCVPDPMSRH